MSETQEIKITHENTMWSVIANFPNYEVCELGLVRRIKDQRLMKQSLRCKNGYLRVGLYNDGGMKTINTHILVGRHFLPNPLNLTVIDHISGDKTDNSVGNLRFVTHSQNRINSKQYAKNTSGVTGVSFDEQSDKWMSHISINGKQKTTRFDTFDDAVTHRKEMERLHYGEFVPTRDVVITIKSTSNPKCPTENKLNIDDSSVITDSTES